MVNIEIHERRKMMFKKRNNDVNFEEKEGKQKPPIYKRKWFIPAVVAFVLIGAFGQDTETAQTETAQTESPKTEAVAVVQTEVVTEAVTEPTTEAVTEEETEIKLPIELVQSILEDHMGELVDIQYMEEEKFFMLTPIGDLATSVSMMPILYDEPEYKDAWKVLVDSMVNLSKNIYKNHGELVALNLVNPENEDLILLSVLNGAVIYNVMDDFE